MENISFINKVKKLKQANIETYSQARRVTSDFRLEKDTTESYNGRQILELLQNCDDALQGYSNSDCVVDIELDFQNKILRVSNYGDPFTEDGVASLLVANTSEKGYELIGNKGLGFRSVLNWVEKVRIYTRNTIISFSEELVRREFEKQFSDEIQKKLIDDNRNRLEKGEVPMAILSMPEIVETDDKENYSTTIELHYLNDKQGDIVKQLSELNSKLLLFLNNIRQINIYLINADDILESERNRSIYINEEKSSDNLIVTNDGTWNLFDSGNIIFDKLNEVDRYYRIKLAWKDDLSDTSSMFYTFFPTHVPTHLPFLIHATFELDPTRNHLNNSSKGENQKILRHIARLMREEVLPKLCKSGGTWLPYKFLLPKHESSVGLLNGFYSMLQGYRNSEAIYPCVNNSYIRKDDAIYHGDKLSQWVLDNGLGEHFPNLIYPIGNVDVEIVGRYSFNEWEKIVERLNRLPEFTSMLRAQLLRILLKESDLNNYFAEIHKSDKKLSLLVNNMGKVIDATKRVFTKDTDEVEYDLPYFIHDIDFISSKFYGDIKTVLKKEIDRAKLDSESGPSRAIKRILDDIVNIGSDDIIDVIQHVVSQTNRELKDNENNSGVVIAMVSSLFSIYKSNPERRGNLTTINNIPLISRIGNIVNAGSLYFGKEYENGKYAEIIFEGVRDDRYYLADNDVWRLDDSRGMLAGFFTWLNVNTLSKFVRIEQKEGRYEESDYAGYMLNWRNHPRRDVHKEYKVESGVPNLFRTKS